MLLLLSDNQLLLILKSTKIITICILTFFNSLLLVAQEKLPVKGLCIAAPSKEYVNEFVQFIDDELGPDGINTLVLRIDFNYTYVSRPELRGNSPLTKKEIKDILAVCKKHNIDLIPQINLLGHQSWAEKTNKLLEVYPEFDETPDVVIPKKYEWPNDDGLYCKSYCPLHPKVHEVVFDLVDEIVDVFEATSFHAGMDEVFYLAHPNCERCNGRDPAELFANEVNKISNHLSQKNIRLWIWGDRLIDGKTTGIGMWEASMNNTARAIDLINKSVVICDWHYENALPTATLFAMKGFDVLTCPWRKPEITKTQVEMTYFFRKNATEKMKEHYQGMLQTVWSPAKKFMDEYKNEKNRSKEQSQAASFHTMIKTIHENELKEKDPM